jgi:biotin transport system ATP-binding protein
MSFTHAPLISLQDVHLVRGRTTVFQGLNLEIRGGITGLIGDNGAGKSSLFRLLCGLDTPSQGQVWVDGQRADTPQDGPRSVGLMFQNPDEQIIFPTVEEELALSLTATGLTRREAVARVRDHLQTRGLGHWAERAIGSLSQGQRQHVCWLALVLMAPRWLLLDEPYASLDLPGQGLLRREIERAPQPILMSTHLLDHVRHLERVIWLDHGQVRADGPGQDVCAAYESHVTQRLNASRDASALA